MAKNVISVNIHVWKCAKAYINTATLALFFDWQVAIIDR